MVLVPAASAPVGNLFEIQILPSPTPTPKRPAESDSLGWSLGVWVVTKLAGLFWCLTRFRATVLWGTAEKE